MLPSYWRSPDLTPVTDGLFPSEVGGEAVPYAKAADPATVGERLALQRLEALASWSGLMPDDASGGADDLLPVKGFHKTSPAFRRRLEDIATALGTDPEWLALVMSFETGESFDPAERNPVSGATGLIQFMPATAHKLGTTTDELAAMTALAQLDYVERYFEPHLGHLATLTDVYMAVLWPSAMGKGPAAVLWSEGSKEYAQNSGLDSNKDGTVTAREAVAHVEAKRLRQPSPATLLVGDSLAVGLTPPLAGQARERGRFFVADALGGTTIKSWANGVKLGNALQSAAPSAVVVVLGTNDAAVPFDGAAKLKDLRTILALIRDRGAAPRWVLHPGLPFNDHGLRELVVKELQAQGVPFYDSAALDFERSGDKIHATPKGYETWAAALAAWLWDHGGPAEPSSSPGLAGGAGLAVAAGAVFWLSRRP